MTDKLIPANPSAVMVIRNITPNIITCSSPFARFGRFKVGGRGTLVKLQSGSIAVFSPVALTPEVKSTVSSLGANVKYIAAPDIEHHIYISEWAKAFPSASILGMEGLPEKREKDPATAGVKFSHVWTSKNKDEMTVDADFDREFAVEYIPGHANKELVFLHKPSKTLIEADLIFNLPAYEQYSKTNGDNPEAGLWTKLFNVFQNTRGDAKWQKRFIWHVGGAADRVSFGESVRKVEGWDFDRIIPCHGDVIDTGGKGVFRKVLEWHLQGQQQQKK